MQSQLAAWLTIASSRLRRQEGQAMLEYTILIGIITVAVISAVLFAGGWVSDQWAALTKAL